jgi:hypothetical protein
MNNEPNGSKQVTEMVLEWGGIGPAAARRDNDDLAMDY